MSETHKAEFEALTKGAGFVELSERSFVSLTGADRQKFFHNFCTNEIKQLKPGDVCENFVLNTKGKILGFVHVIARPDELLLTGHSNQAAALIAHLDMYLIREDVELGDKTEELASLFVCGELAKSKLGSVVNLPDENQTTESKLGETNVTVTHLELAGFGFLINFPKTDLDSVKSTLASVDMAECSPAALHVVRVANGTPWFGIDADDSNLPQELQRDDKAINFNKGCYLGQETVARIDARGRVNQLLVQFNFDGAPPEPGTELIEDTKVVGRITSTAQHPNTGANIGLGYVRRAFREPGTRIGNAIVK